MRGTFRVRVDHVIVDRARGVFVDLGVTGRTRSTVSMDHVLVNRAHGVIVDRGRGERRRLVCSVEGSDEFCEGGTAEGATVAQSRGVVLRPATVVKGDATVVQAERRVLATGRFRWSGVRAPSQGSGGGHAEAVGRSGGVTPPRQGGGECARERKFLAGLSTGVGGGFIGIIK